MDLQLAGQTAVVVGGASGIGRAIAEAFAAERASVALFDINPVVEASADEIAAKFGVKTFGAVADVADYAAMQKSAAQVVARLDRCDHVVFAAGMGSGKYGFPFWNLQPADWRRVVEVNLLGAVNTAHAFAPPLIEARSGTFLFLSSVAGQIGSQTDPPYSAAKAAIINFAQCAAKDLAPYNVRVNVLSPGMVKTAVNRSVWQAWHDQQPQQERIDYDAWAAEKIQRVAPLGRWQTPQDMAAAAVFLASPLAKNITGQTLNVDGGQVMHS